MHRNFRGIFRGAFGAMLPNLLQAKHSSAAGKPY